MSVAIAMPRDLRARRLRAGYCAVLAVASAARPGLLRIASSVHVETYLRYLRRDLRQRDLTIQRLVWTPGPEIAGTVLAALASDLSGMNSGDKWYRVDVSVFDAALTSALDRQRVPRWTHGELVALLDAQADAEADRFSQGIF